MALQVSGSGRRVLTPGPLRAAGWDPFGWLPVADTDPRDAGFNYEFAWGDAHVNVIAHGPEEVERADGLLVCDRFYRHDTHTQTLLVLDRPSVIVVVPAARALKEVADLDSARAFIVRPLEGFALFRGTWHWGPFPLGDEPVHLWNLQGKRYAEDNRCADLVANLGTVLHIPTPSEPA